MFSFKNDYSEGAHQRILHALLETNLEQADGYSEDIFTEEAIQLMKNQIKRDDVDIHILPGGTQTNLTAISAFLRPHEAVISAHTGHILVHETGSIEATGHKVIAMPSPDGKITVKDVELALNAHTDEHMVKPKMVYISNTTEIGTLYTKGELVLLSDFCKSKGLYLYMDGARLGSALTANGNDVTLEDLGALLDGFYIGGTKNGALLGEALVIINDALKADFRFHIKQKGALLAKGRILGIQFRELFTDGLFFELASHANQMAERLSKGIHEAGYTFMIHSSTNQIFPILPDSLIEKLQKKYDFYVWEKRTDGLSAIRLVTSWATDEGAVQEFIFDLNSMAE